MKHLGGKKVKGSLESVVFCFPPKDFQAILVEKDSSLLELCRSVVLNPVRAKLVESVY